jgi:hypothetical protein
MTTIIKPIYAIINNPILPDTTSVTQPKTYFNNVISTIFSLLMIVAVLYFVLHFVMAGFRLMDSRGDPKKLESAREELLNAFIGLGAVFAVFAILRFIGTIFGLESLRQLQIIWPNLL